MATTSEVFSVERQDHVATLWLDSPERRNAMGPAFWQDLPRLIQELGDDPEVRAIVLAAKGPHFTVGLDLKAFQNLGYTGEWFVFAGFVVFMWFRLLHREAEFARDAELGLAPAVSEAASTSEASGTPDTSDGPDSSAAGASAAGAAREGATP